VAPRGAGREAFTSFPLRIGTPLTRSARSLFFIAYEPLSIVNEPLTIIDKPSERSPLATNSYLLFIKAPRAVVHPVSATHLPAELTIHHGESGPTQC